MATLKLLFAELWFRRLNFVLSLSAVTAAAMLYVAGPVLVQGYGTETTRLTGQIDTELAEMEDQTRKLMLTMGFNLMIVPANTNMADFWADDFSNEDMPESYVRTLAESPHLEHIRHLVATLQQRVRWNDRNVLLVGYQKEVPQTHFASKKPMGYSVPKGQVYLGYELWKPAGLKEGDPVEFLGDSFTLARALPERGSKEDITVAMNLVDAQRLLDKQGRVNQIFAIGCECDGDRLGTIRKELAQTLPETKITEFESIAQARAEQRDLVAAKRQDIAEQRSAIQATISNLALVVTPLVVLVCAVWVGLLAMSNVRERRPEIGLLRAIGKRSRYIAGLFLGKAFLLGLVGGGLGYLAGSALARAIGIQFFGVDASDFSPAYGVLISSLVGAPLVCLVASYLPTLRALMQDPAVILRDV